MTESDGELFFFFSALQNYPSPFILFSSFLFFKYTEMRRVLITVHQTFLCPFGGKAVDLLTNKHKSIEGPEREDKYKELISGSEGYTVANHPL